MTLSASHENNAIFPSTKSFSNIHKLLEVPDLINIQ